MAKVKDLLVNGSSRFIGKIYASDQFISQVANGTAPFVVSSSTLVANLNADMTDGLHVHTGRNNEVNKIVRTDANGYIQTGYINTNVGTENLAISRIFYEYNNDGYIRKMSPSSFFSVLENSGNDISITVAGQNKKLTVGYASNSDKLDNIDSTGFLRQVVVPNNTENDFNTFSNMTLTGRVDPTTGASLKNAPWSGSGPAGGYGVLTYLFNGSSYGTQMAWGYGSNRIYIRNRHYGGSGVGLLWSTSWDSIALTSDIPTSLPANGGNADTVDGYHASNLWRSDGGVWNPSANITLGASANGQEWSFDISRNGYTGCLWHVWDSSRNTMLSVTPDDGKVRAPYGFVGNLEGTATSASSVAWSNVTGKPINLKAYSGSLSSAGWKILQGNNSSPSIAISYNNSAANWNSGTYSASMVWGCTDTRGLIDCAYNTPKVTFGGCSFGGATDNNPTWYFKLAGTTGTEYNLDTRWSLVGHNHDGKYLRKDANDSTSYQYEFTKTNDHAIKVGTIRGRAVGSQTGEYIHLYERVAIGSPSGWGSRNAPTYGLATYGGAWLATDTGNVGIGTTSPGYKLQISGDSYTTGWSRAANGFYVEGTGVHFTHQGGLGEIDMTSNNEFLWGSSTATLYFNHRAVSRGTTVNNYIWNAGSSTSWASHNMGNIWLNGSGVYLRLGPQNSSHAHYETTASVSHWFNKRVDVNGDIWRYNTNYGIASDGQFYAKAIYANRDGASTYGGISLYSTSDPITQYGIAFRGTGNYGKIGRVQGDWATYFTMDSSHNRGWIFRSGGTNYASVSARGEAYFNSVGTDHYIAYPSGGFFSSDGSKSGYIIITIPANYRSSTMMRFNVEIYNYSTGTSTTYTIGGYNYSDGNWYNVFAYANRQGTTGYGNLTVRFGHNGTNSIIWIGESNTSYSYPKVRITNVTLGYGTIDYNTWAAGWSVTIATTTPTNVSQTVTNPATNYYA